MAPSSQSQSNNNCEQQNDDGFLASCLLIGSLNCATTTARSQTQNVTESTHSYPTERNDSILAPLKYHAHFLTQLYIERLQLYRSAVKPTKTTKMQQCAGKVVSTQKGGFLTFTDRSTAKVLLRAL